VVEPRNAHPAAAWSGSVAGVAAAFETYRAWAEAAIRDDAAMPPVARLVGFRMMRIADGEADFVLDARPEHANPMGSLHGGILCDVLDAAMTSALASTLGPGETITTLELAVNFLRPHWTGRVDVAGRVVHAGRTLGVAEGEARDDRGRLLARAKTTCMVLRGTQAQGR
jgi:uncharacterized protein (TIGR00369 family)